MNTTVSGWVLAATYIPVDCSYNCPRLEQTNREKRCLVGTSTPACKDTQSRQPSHPWRTHKKWRFFLSFFSLPTINVVGLRGREKDRNIPSGVVVVAAAAAAVTLAGLLRTRLWKQQRRLSGAKGGEGGEGRGSDKPFPNKATLGLERIEGGGGGGMC